MSSLRRLSQRLLRRSLGLLLAFLAAVALTGLPYQASPLLAQTPFEQGLAAYQAGQPHQAIQVWQQALQSATMADQQAPLWGNLAVAYYATGQYQKALEANQTALALFSTLGQAVAVGQVQTNLGNVYEALGEYDRAIAIYQSSLDIAKNNQDRQTEAIILGNLGYLYFLQGNLAEALRHYEAGLAIARENENLETESYQLLNLGLVYHTNHDIDQAKDLYQQCLALARQLNNSRLVANALANLGIAEADQGQYNVAIDYYEQGLAVLETLDNPDLIAKTLNNLGHTLLKINQLEAAEARLREAITTLDQLRLGVSQDLAISVFDTQIYSYNLLQQVLIGQNKIAEALEISEAGRGRALTEQLQRRLIPSVDNPNIASMVAPTAPISLDEIRQLANLRNTTLVEYSLIPDDEFKAQGRQRGRTAELYIWVVKPDGGLEFRQRLIDSQRQSLEEMVTLSRDTVGTRSRAGIQVTYTDAVDPTETLKDLYHLLIAPIQDLLPADPEAQVMVVPQGDLFMVPFPALMAHENDYLIQHHTLLMAPSIHAADLTQQQTAQRPGARGQYADTVLIVGNPAMPNVWDALSETMQPLLPLPGAEQEAIQIADFFGVRALLADAAQEATIKQRMVTARIIHLATHGLLEYGSPQASGVQDMPGAIALAPGQGQDGLLTSAEILDELSLQADLVVLSACDTGRGDITGDGVVGLSRSLMAAGAASVVVSLWAVPDAPTADLMVQFYQQLQAGQPKAQALRQAMLNTMTDHPNPKDWAAFTLMGATQ